jgi:hypothetical protein
MYEPKDTGSPPTFADSLETVWQIKLTGDLIDSVQAATQIDLMPDNGDYTPVINLIKSHRKLGAVLWACVERSAQTNGIDRAQFFQSLDAPTYLKGWEALLDAIYFFIRALSQTQSEAFLAMVEATMKVNAAEAETQIELLRSQSTDESLKEAVEKIKARMQDELKKEFASYAGNLPRLQEPRRAPIRSAN